MFWGNFKKWLNIILIKTAQKIFKKISGMLFKIAIEKMCFKINQIKYHLKQNII